MTHELVRVAGEVRAVDLEGRRHPGRAVADGDRILVWSDGETFVFSGAAPRGTRSRASAEEAGLRAPMPGKILRTLAREGQEVSRGATLLILEAMKMEHEIKAPRDGRIARMPFREGEQVEAGAKLVEFAS